MSRLSRRRARTMTLMPGFPGLSGRLEWAETEVPARHREPARRVRTSASQAGADLAPLGRPARLLFAGSALLASAGILGALLALAGHYDDEFLQAERAPAAGDGPHARAPAEPHALPAGVRG